MVLPEPTSRRRRFIGLLEFSSAEITSSTLRRPAVSSVGSDASAPGQRPSARRGAGGPDSESSPWRRWARAHCNPTASSKVSCSRARSRSASLSARWIAAARHPGIRRRWRTTLSGSGSATGIEYGQHLAHAGEDVPALQFGAGSEIGKKSPKASIASSPSRTSEHVGDRLERSAPNTRPSVRRVQREEVRMGELHGAAEASRPRRTASTGPRHQIRLEVSRR